jgi:hypothetical protein
MAIIFSLLYIVQACTIISPYIFATSESQLEKMTQWVNWLTTAGLSLKYRIQSYLSTQRGQTTRYRWQKYVQSQDNIVLHVLDFKLSPCLESCVYSFGYFPGVWLLKADVSEHSICSIFMGWIWSVKYGRLEEDTLFIPGTCPLPVYHTSHFISSLWRWNR